MSERPFSNWASVIIALLVLALSLAAAAGTASAIGPGGWDHVGDGGTAGTDSLNFTASALNTDSPGVLLVGGGFTDAGGEPNADRIASWDGTDWSAVSSASSQISNGSVNAIAYANGKVYAGGTFTNAGGDPNADFLAVWDGASWAPACNDTMALAAFGGNVNALEIVGSTLYVGGSFQNGAHIPAADGLLACDLTTGNSSSPFDADGDNSGSIYALAADSSGILYAAGTFVNIDGIPAADYVAAYTGTWSGMGAGAPNGGAVDGITRSLSTNGTDLYVGSDAINISGIPQADHVAMWNGSAWSAVGAGSGGSNGFFSTTTTIDGLLSNGSVLYATGSFQNADGNLQADSVAKFDGSAWNSLGSDGAGNGPLNANGLALALFNSELYAAGGFTAAGGDTNARGIARYPPPPGPTARIDARVACSPSSVVVGEPTTCTTYAFDGSIPWYGNTPSGFITLTTDSAGSFLEGATCTLSTPQGGLGRQAECALSYAPTTSGNHVIGVDYPWGTHEFPTTLAVTEALKIGNRGACSANCRELEVKVDFETAGRLVAEQAGGGAGAAFAKKPKQLIKRLVKAVRPGENVLKLKLTGTARKKLDKSGKLRVKVRFTFTPTGGAAASQVQAFTVKAKKG